MAFRQNGYFNDPTIGQAFSNLAQAFAPPSGSDLAGYASAAATRQKTAGLAELLKMSTSPTFNRDAYDRFGAALGAFNPNQGFGARDMDDARQRRGQDLDLRAKTYATDVNARTSVQNNELDNRTTRRGQDIVSDTTIRKATMDNENDLKRQSLVTQADVVKSAFQPLKPGETAVPIPQQFMAPFGLPGVEARAGLPPILSEEQTKGAILRGLPENEQRAVATAGVKTATVMNPQTGRPEEVASVDAVGRQPYVKPQAENLKNYITPEGKNGTAVYDENAGGWKDTQTGTAIPAGSRTFTAALQGDATGTGLSKTTEASDRNAYTVTLIDDATKRIDDKFATGRLPTQQDFVIFQAMQKLPALAAPALVKNMSPDAQEFYQDIKTAIPMRLLTQSGQGVTEAEYERTIMNLIPVPGEDQRVSAAKREQFNKYLTAVRGLAGASLSKVEAVKKADAAAAAAPLPPASGLGADVGSALDGLGGGPRRMKFNPTTGRVE